MYGVNDVRPYIFHDGVAVRPQRWRVEENTRALSPEARATASLAAKNCKPA